MMLAQLSLIGLLWVAQDSRGQPAPTTAPSTQPAADAAVVPADEVLNQMLRPLGQSAPPLRPIPSAPSIDRTTGAAAVAPGAESLTLLREGTYVIDRVGRLSRSVDGSAVEFLFEADGKAMKDPPVIVIPNLKLMAMESAARSAARDLRFRVTGMVTEYNGRNHLLLEKVVVIPDGQ